MQVTERMIAAAIAMLLVAALGVLIEATDDGAFRIPESRILNATQHEAASCRGRDCP